jgi:AcrR family transcriptional regulator
MAAAQRLFLELGFARTTIENITSAAQVAKGTFYLYFKSKEDVRAALEDRFGDDHLARIRNAVARKSAGDWMGKISAWVSASVASYLDSIELHDVLFYEGRSPTREGLVDNIVITHLAELLREGERASAWSVDDPRAAAVFIFSGVHAVVDDAYSKERPVNRRRLTQRLERLCFAALGPGPSQPSPDGAAE